MIYHEYLYEVSDSIDILIDSNDNLVLIANTSSENESMARKKQRLTRVGVGFHLSFIHTYPPTAEKTPLESYRK
jgi:hypothetical protein